jgi:hypothetical protein
MELRLRLTRLRVALVAIVLGLVTAGVAYATIPDSGGVFTACKLNATGTIRLIDPAIGGSSLLGHCVSLETKLTWGQAAKGDQGVQGIQGIQGPAGPPGASDVHGYFGGTYAFTNVAAGETASAASLSLPAGKYLVSGSVEAINIALSGAPAQTLVGICVLHGAGTDWGAFTAHSVAEGAFVPVPVQAAITLSEPAEVTIDCRLGGPAGASLRYGRGHLQAQQVDTLTPG